MEIAGEKIFPRSIGPVGFGPSRAVAKIEVSYYNGATACNIGSSALLVQLISLSAYQPSLKQIEFAAAVHLPSDELEASDLHLGLSVGPGQYDCRANRRFIVRYAAGGDKAGASALDPGWQLGGGSAPDHPMEFGYDLSSSTRVGTPASTAATVIVSAFESPPDRHETSDRSGRWDPVKIFDIGTIELFNQELRLTSDRRILIARLSCPVLWRCQSEVGKAGVKGLESCFNFEGARRPCWRGRRTASSRAASTASLAGCMSWWCNRLSQQSVRVAECLRSTLTEDRKSPADWLHSFGREGCLSRWS